MSDLHAERGKARRRAADDLDGATVKVVGVSFVDGYPGNLTRLSDLWDRAGARSLPAFLVREPDNTFDE